MANIRHDAVVAKPQPRTYDSILRRAQADGTRQAIVAAARERLKTTMPDALAYATLADDTGIAQRTIYRHFPERAALFAAVAQLHLRAMFGGEPPSLDPPTQAKQLAQFHRVLTEEAGSYRLMMSSPARSQAGGSALFERILKDVLARAPKAERATLVGVFELFCSPYFWEVLHSQNGVPPERVTRAALVMCAMMREAFTKDPALFDPARPMPAWFRARDDADHPRPRAGAKRQRATKNAPTKRTRGKT